MLALAALCVLVAAAAWVLTPRPEADGGAGGGGGAVPEQGAPSVLAPAAPSSSERFLADLERDARDGGGPAAVAWEVPGDLPGPASEVLSAYRAVPTASLAVSGYLDLKGNVWGAVVRDSRGWVDVVHVSTTEAAERTEVRVARLAREDL